MRPFTNRWAVLGLVHAARIAMAVHFQAIPPLAPQLARDLSLSQSQIGLLIGLFMSPGVMLAIPSGLLAQRFGDKRVTLAGLALLTIGAVLLMAAPSFAVALAARLIGGIGLVLVSVVSNKIVTDWFSGREIATAMGIMLTAWPLGIAVSLSTLGTLAALTSWQAAVGATAVLSALTFALLAFCYADPPRAAAAPSAAAHRLWQITGAETLLIGVVGAIWGMANAGYIAFIAFAPAWLRGTGLGTGAAGIIVGLSSWAMIGSVPLGGWALDRVRRPNLFIMLGTGASAAAIALFAVAGMPALWTFLFGVVTGLWAAAIMTLPGEVLSAKGRATGFGVFYVVNYGFVALGPTLAGLAADRAGTLRAAFAFSALAVLLAGALLLPFRMLQRALARRAA